MFSSSCTRDLWEGRELFIFIVFAICCTSMLCDFEVHKMHMEVVRKINIVEMLIKMNERFDMAAIIIFEKRYVQRKVCW